MEEWESLLPELEEAREDEPAAPHMEVVEVASAEPASSGGAASSHEPAAAPARGPVVKAAAPGGDDNFEVVGGRECEDRDLAWEV